MWINGFLWTDCGEEEKGSTPSGLERRGEWQTPGCTGGYRDYAPDGALLQSAKTLLSTGVFEDYAPDVFKK
jgi:hypothetical protein